LIHTNGRTDEGPHIISAEGRIYEDSQSVATTKTTWILMHSA